MMPFLISAALSLTWALVHLFLGGRGVARPLRAAALPEDVRATAWMCWHFVTVTLFLMAAFFGMAALGETAMAAAGTALALAFMAVGIWARFAMGVSFAQLPQGWLFLPVAGAGIWGLLAA